MKNKMKTKKALAKRVKITGKKKLKISHAMTSHLAHGKTQKQKRHLRKSSIMSKSDYKREKKMLPGKL